LVGELSWTGLPDEEEGRKPFTTGLPADVVFGFYRDQCERANAIVAATPLSAPLRGRHPVTGRRGLRPALGHLGHVRGDGRHAGHLDIARELADNRTGLGQRYARRAR
jgi:hypothetical protein